MTQICDRKVALKAFDDTKAGVKGLVDSGVTKLPPIFIEPPENMTQDAPTLPLNIPVIDLQNIEKNTTKHKQIVEEIRVASETWEFFQLINHGIDASVLEEMMAGVKRFHEQAQEVKAEYYTRDRNKKVVYHSNFNLYQLPAANWRDTIYAIMLPNFPDFLDPQELPMACRDIFIQYSKHIMQLGTKLLELLSEALGLSPNHLKDMDCGEGVGIAGHYYPACPEPELTLGATKHSDNDFLTVVLQDQIGGLQFRYQNHWVDVPALHGALVVNIGDLLQLVSNDKFKSSEHRVIANKEGPRISVPSFFNTSNHHKVYGPIKELISEQNPPMYKETTVQDYTASYNVKDGGSTLARYRL